VTLFVDPGVPAPLPRQSISGGDVVPGARDAFLGGSVRGLRDPTVRGTSQRDRRWCSRSLQRTVSASDRHGLT
jgi:hypothetical protein